MYSHYFIKYTSYSLYALCIFTFEKRLGFPLITGFTPADEFFGLNLSICRFKCSWWYISCE